MSLYHENKVINALYQHLQHNINKSKEAKFSIDREMVNENHTLLGFNFELYGKRIIIMCLYDDDNNGVIYLYQFPKTLQSPILVTETNLESILKDLSNYYQKETL